MPDNRKYRKYADVNVGTNMMRAASQKALRKRQLEEATLVTRGHADDHLGADADPYGNTIRTSSPVIMDEEGIAEQLTREDFKKPAERQDPIPWPTQAEQVVTQSEPPAEAAPIEKPPAPSGKDHRGRRRWKYRHKSS